MPETYTEEQTARAVQLLNACGVRIFRQGDKLVIGVWSDLVCSELRAMLAAVNLDSLEFVPLEGPDVPLRLKLRRSPERRPNQSWSHYRDTALASLARSQRGSA